MEEKAQIEIEMENQAAISTVSPGRLPLEAPPAYAAPAQTSPPKYSSDSPPAYDAVFGKVRKAKEESDGNVDYACKVFAMVCCGTICTILQVVLCLAIPVSSIVIGAMNLKDCTIEKYIPIYLIVAGVFGVIKGFLNCIMAIVKKKRKDDESEDESKKNRPNPVDSILNCFLVAWFIAGSVWVYRIYGEVNYDDATSSMYCDKTTYLFTFWIITIGYIFMALALLCCCGVCAVMCCIAVGSAATGGSD